MTALARHEMAILPNQDGFRFIGITHAGERIDCEVRKTPVGTHNVYRVSDGAPAWFQLAEWEQKQ